HPPPVSQSLPRWPAMTAVHDIRDPFTYPAAVLAAIRALGQGERGKQAVAAAAGVSVSMVEKWVNETHPAQPGLHQAEAIDLAVRRATGKAGPIETLYALRLQRAGVALVPVDEDLHIVVAGIHVAGGDMTREVLIATARESEHGRGISPRERKRLLHCLSQAWHGLHRVERAIEATCRRCLPHRRVPRRKEA
ncbi:MAG: hypothetical protein K2Q10_11025, partial [Rhodospirillales bacterium]|nr:hypothetical protein [Rhodospirillales bacterium]